MKVPLAVATLLLLDAGVNARAIHIRRAPQPQNGGLDPGGSSNNGGSSLPPSNSGGTGVGVDSVYDEPPTAAYDDEDPEDDHWQGEYDGRQEDETLPFGALREYVEELEVVEADKDREFASFKVRDVWDVKGANEYWGWGELAPPDYAPHHPF